MSYKIKEMIENVKKQLPIYIIIWAFLVVLLILPLSYASKNASAEGGFNLNIFVNACGEAMNNLASTLGKSISPEYLGNSLKLASYFTIAYVIVIAIATIKNAGKGEFRDIEHGSSDWSKGGEQYRVLSNKKGIILAENNYLPLDKRGNVNVLIVGRIRFW